MYWARVTLFSIVLSACSDDSGQTGTGGSHDPSGPVVPPPGSVDNLRACGRYGLGPASFLGVSADGTEVAVSGSNIVVLFSRPSGAVLHKFPASAPVQAMDLSADGKKLALGTRHRVSVFDAASGELASDVQGPFSQPSTTTDGSLLGMRLSPDGSRLAIWSSDRVTLRALGGDALALDLARQLPQGSDVVAFAPDGSTIAIRTMDAVELVDTASSSVLRSIPMPLNQPYGAVALGPGGLLAAGDDSGVVRVWRGSDPSPILDVSLGSAAESVAFSADGVRIGAVTTSAASLGVWDLASRNRLVTQNLVTPYGDSSYRAGVGFSPSGDVVLTTAPFQVKGFRVADGADAEAYSWGNTGRFVDAAVSPDGRLIASSGLDGVVVWNRTTEDIVAKPTGLSPFLSGQVAFSPDGKRLYSTSQGTVLAWDSTTWSLVTKNDLHPSEITQLLVSPNGTRLLAGIMDNEYMIIASDTLSRTVDVQTPRSFGSDGAFTPDGSAFLGAKSETVLGVWDAKSGAELHSRDLGNEVAPIVLASSGSRVVVGVGNDLRILGWPGLDDIYRFDGTMAPSNGTALVGDDHHVLSLFTDVILWDVAFGTVLSKGSVDEAGAPHIPLPPGMKASILIARPALRLYCNDDQLPATFFEQQG